MALTEKKRRFAAAKRSGLSNKEAAILAGCPEKTAAQAGSRMAKDPDVLAAIERTEAVEQVKAEAKSQGREVALPDLGKMYSDPQDFLKAVMNDPEQDAKLRTDAAKALMPYVHQKLGEGGKKDAAAGAAKKAAGGRFGPAAPPKLVASGGKRL
ncbi:MAG: terminase small subunit [Castellaniella sp.]|nr:terminase small subunit [Castellaniella sp.]